MTSVRLLVIACLIILLSGCGFTLRGSQTSQLSVTQLALNLQQENSPFARALRSTLNSIDVDIGDNDADYTLTVGQEEHSVRQISVTGRASAAQYELSSAVNVELHNRAGELLLGPEIINVQKTYFEDIANIAGSSSEMELLRAEMRQELVDQLIRRLQSVANDG